MSTQDSGPVLRDFKGLAVGVRNFLTKAGEVLTRNELRRKRAGPPNEGLRNHESF